MNTVVPIFIYFKTRKNIKTKTFKFFMILKFEEI